MGYYISIEEKETGRRIIENKYGVGYAMLMFDSYKKGKDNKDVIYEVSGERAIENLDSVLDYIKNNLDETNFDALSVAQSNLQEVRNRIRKDKTYQCDFREALYIVDNPDFDPMSCIEEMRENLEDLINSYFQYGKRSKDNMSKMLETYFKNLSEELRGCFVSKEGDNVIILTTAINFNEEDLRRIKTGKINNDKDNFEYEKRYAERKLFYILKMSGFNFEICHKSKTCFYIIIDRKEAEDWYATRPYVECSYQFTTTYPIRHLVRNTPKEKEKFYCYAKWKTDVEKIVIDGIDVTNATDEEVSSIIGKKLCRCCYDSNEIDMVNMSY